MITVIQDSQEKMPWNFRTYTDFVESQVIKKIPTGDYTILGHETEFIVERKKSVDELALNLGQLYTRFRKELVRMREFKEAYIVCEFSSEDLINYPATSNLNKYSWNNKKSPIPRMKGKSMYQQINTIQEVYNLKFIFAMNRANARDTVLNLMKEFDERLRTQIRTS